MTQAKGLNIVLNTDSVNQYLQLTNVKMYELKSRSLTHDYIPITELVPVINDFFKFDPRFVSEFNMFMNNGDYVNWEFFKN